MQQKFGRELTEDDVVYVSSISWFDNPQSDNWLEPMAQLKGVTLHPALKSSIKKRGKGLVETGSHNISCFVMEETLTKVQHEVFASSYLARRLVQIWRRLAMGNIFRIFLDRLWFIVQEKRAKFRFKTVCRKEIEMGNLGCGSVKKLALSSSLGIVFIYSASILAGSLGFFMIEIAPSIYKKRAEIALMMKTAFLLGISFMTKLKIRKFCRNIISLNFNQNI